MKIENKCKPNIRLFLNPGVNMYLLAYILLVFISCQKRDQEIWLEFHYFPEIKHNGDIYVRTKSGKESYVFRLNYDNGDICEYNLIKDDETFILDGSYFCLSKERDTIQDGIMNAGKYHVKRFFKNGKIFRKQERFYHEDEFVEYIEYDSLGNIFLYTMNFEDSSIYKVMYDSLGNRAKFSGIPVFVIRELNENLKGSNKIYGNVYLVQEPGVDSPFVYLRYPELFAQDSLAQGQIKRINSLKYYFEVTFSKSGTYNIPFFVGTCDVVSNMPFTHTFEILTETE